MAEDAGPEAKTAKRRFVSFCQMSHYQHNINAPQFPPGVHMAHYSLANTTLIGQEVQQRLWEKYWEQQGPAPPPAYMWYHPGMCYHGYPYGMPPTFHHLSAGFDQSQHRVLMPMSRQENSSDASDKTLQAHPKNDVAEVLVEGNSWQTNTKRTSKQKQGFNSTVDPVTDDLTWNIFSSDLADGIVVSILDSFACELPVLDITLVQSILQAIDKNSPQPEAQDQECVSKKEYFNDIVSLPTWQYNNDETNSKEPARSNEVTVNAKQTLGHFTSLSEPNAITNVTEKARSSSPGLHTIGKTFQEEDICSDVTVASPDKSNTSENVITPTNCSSTDGQIMELIANNNEGKEVTTVQETP